VDVRRRPLLGLQRRLRRVPLDVRRQRL